MDGMDLGARPVGVWAPDAINGLCAAAWPNLVRRLAAITRDFSAAEEITQEALLRLSGEVRAGRPPNDPTAWAYRVGFNLAMSRGRRIQVAVRRSHELLDRTAPDPPDDRVIEQERHVAMLRAFAELRPDDRLILTLAATGCAGDEIARRTGRSHGAVRARIHRLRVRLRARLAELEAA